MANVTAAIKPNTKLIWCETPTNPTLKITDIAAVSAVAKAANKGKNLGTINSNFASIPSLTLLQIIDTYLPI